MRVVAFAYHDMGIVGLEALVRNGFEIKAIFSHEDDPGENIWFRSVASWGKVRSIPVLCPQSVNTPDWVERIREFAPEAMFSFYYRRLLSREILEIPPAGAYNLHGSLLPAYRGRCPVNWVLIKGETFTGVTLHHMTEQADAGDIVGQREIPIGLEETARSLYGKLCEETENLLDHVLPLIKNGSAPRTPQDPQKASYFGGRRPEDGRIDWSWEAARIFNLVRALTEPYPGAFTFLPQGDRILIWWARQEYNNPGPPKPAGTLLVSHDQAVVAAGKGSLILTDIEVEGGRIKGEKEIADSLSSHAGDKLE